MSNTTTPPEWQVITGKALIASRTPWGTIAGGIVAWVVTRYGLNWDQSTCNLVTGLAVIAASYGMRYITSQPITGILTAKPVTAPVRNWD
jgi:hypothetical protein